MDVAKQIAYWRDGSRKALRSIPSLEAGEFWTEALFWMHLAIEKALKAHVTKFTCDVPPYIHKLVRLAEIAQMNLSPEQLLLCEELSIFQRVSRYPDEAITEPPADKAKQLLNDARYLQEWLLQKL